MSVAEHEEEFSYSVDAENGPSHWGEIKEEWSACGEGEMQSLVDLAGPHVTLVRRLGHLNHDALRLALRHCPEHVIGLLASSCQACQLGKSTRLPFSSAEHVSYFPF